MPDHKIALDRSDDGRIATVTMTNPPRHTMTAAMVTDIDNLLDVIDGDDDIRVVVLTGGGEGVFIAHYEVNELADSAERQRAASLNAQQPGAPQGAQSPPPPAATAASAGAQSTGDAAPARLHPFNRIMRRLELMPKVTVAAMNGSAAGGGFELALSCDFRLMADGPYRVGLPETGVGIIPGAGGTQRLTRLLGVARALDLILHGTRLTPAQALDLGLVSRLVPADTFRQEIETFAAALARRAPVALAAAKEAIRTGVELPLDDGLLLEQQLFNQCMRSEDAAGAMRASLQGQRYEFEGR